MAGNRSKNNVHQNFYNSLAIGLALGAGIGVALGTGVGVALGHIALGAAFGTSIGAAFGGGLWRRLVAGGPCDRVVTMMNEWLVFSEFLFV